VHLTVHGTSVYLILRGPGGFVGGKVCDAMISQLDLYPTLCDLLNIEKPEWLQGKSLDAGYAGRNAATSR
jgi:arylsulfatase A-like enzyme